MRAPGWCGALGVAVLALIGVVAVRGTAPEPEAPGRIDRAPAAEVVPAAPAREGDPIPKPASDSTLTAALRGEVTNGDIPSQIPSGPSVVEGPGGASPLPAELALTPSQATVVEALLRERDAALDGLRGLDADVSLIVTRAQAAQDRFLTSVRGSLLPDQRDRFEKLYAAGTWGGYTLVIPTRR